MKDLGKTGSSFPPLVDDKANCAANRVPEEEVQVLSANRDVFNDLQIMDRVPAHIQCAYSALHVHYLHSDLPLIQLQTFLSSMLRV